MPYRVRRRRPIDFILPFLIFIAGGVIVVLGFNLYHVLTERSEDSSAMLYIAEGNATMKLWGEKEWKKAYHSMKILEGDSLRISSNSRAVLQFSDKTILRLDGNAEVIFQTLEKSQGNVGMLLSLKSGKIWVNVPFVQGLKTNVSVEMENSLVRSPGTIFEVEKNDTESTRVLDGKVTMDIFIQDGSKRRVLESYDVGVGQEVILKEKDVKAIRAFESPRLLAALSEEFRSSEWYNWNMQEDGSPTDFAKIAKEGSLSSQKQANVLDTTSNELNQSVSTDTVDRDPPPPAEIVSPAPQKRTINVGVLTIEGKVTSDVATVKVTHIAGGKSGPFVLKKFKKGDATFHYGAGESYGNLVVGENLYRVTVKDEAGNESEPTEITVVYEKPDYGSLTAPIVLSYNGSLSPEVLLEPVKVVGKVSGAAKVVVNSYELKSFAPGSTEWVYAAAVKYENLKPGENVYEVYAVSPDGTKSEVTTFKIIYTPSS